MYKIGIDIGYGNTKIITEGKKVYFPSLAKPGEKINMDQMLSASGDYVATINGKTWYIGHMAAKESRFAIRAFDDAERFTNPAFQAMLATALFVGTDNEAEVMLVTGLPLSSYKNSQEEFQKFLTGFSAKVEIDGQEKHVKVKQAFVFPQAAGVFFNPSYQSLNGTIKPGDLVTIMDIGYRTTDFATFEYNENKPELIMEYSFTADTGMVSVFRVLAEKMAGKNGMFAVSLESAERTYLTDQQEYTDVCQTISEETVDNITEAYKLNGPGKERKNHIIAAGGGSVALKDYLVRRFPEMIVLEDAQFANAIGFYTIGKRLDINPFE